MLFVVNPLVNSEMNSQAKNLLFRACVRVAKMMFLVILMDNELQTCANCISFDHNWCEEYEETTEPEDWCEDWDYFDSGGY